MKSYKELPKDIYKLLENRKGSKTWEDEKLVALGASIAKHTADTMSEDKVRVRNKDVFYPSEIGKNCLRQVWYKYNLPVAPEPLSGVTQVKFLFGDYVEELMLYLAKEAGHTVEAEQHPVEIHVDDATVRGRIDAVIDGAIIDVKSTTSYNFKQWNGGYLGPHNDAFGYRWQLNSYSRGLIPGVVYSGSTTAPECGLFFMDKASGAIGTSAVPHLADWENRVRSIHKVVNSPEPPPRLDSVALKTDSLNHGIPLECQYCDYKKYCWADRDLTRVARSSRAIWLVSHSADYVELGPRDFEINTDVEEPDE